MPKQAKSVQIRCKVPKYVANAWRWRTPAGDRSAQQGVWLWYIQSISLGWGLWRGISITPRRLYVIILRAFVIPPSTPFNLNDVEKGLSLSACDFRPHYPIRITSLMGQDGLRMVSDLDPQIDGRTQCVKICFVRWWDCRMRPCTKAVHTCNSLNWSEVA